MTRGSFLCAVYFLFNQRMNDMLFQYVVSVKGYEAHLYVTAYGSVNVRINGSYHYDPSMPPRVGAIIIKKCRKAFLEWWATADVEELQCTPYGGDKKDDFRKKVFEWCGFTSYDGFFFTLTKPQYKWRIRFKHHFDYISLSR